MTHAHGSYLGGIRSLHDLRERCVIDDSGCWLWPGAMAGGVTPCFRVHQLGRSVAGGAGICFLKTGELPAPGVVWHRTCDHARCVRPTHRIEGTRKSQMARLIGTERPAMVRVRIAVAKRASSKLSDAAVDVIRAGEGTATAAGARHGCTTAHASRIRRHEVRRSLAASVYGWEKAA